MDEDDWEILGIGLLLAVLFGIVMALSREQFTGLSPLFYFRPPDCMNIGLHRR